jgi:tetratricopeptide (TPR) repeat protein
MRPALLLGIVLLAAPALAAPPTPLTIGEAASHHRKGIMFYELGDFDDAITEFKRAYEITDAPALLFNIAQAYRKKGDLAQALHFYETFIRLAPHARNRGDAEVLVVEMQAKLAEQARLAHEPPAPPDGGAPVAAPAPLPPVAAPAPPVAAPAPVVVVEPPPPPRPLPVYKRWYVWTSVGVVVAAGAAVGLSLGLTRTALPSGQLGTIDGR